MTWIRRAAPTRSCMMRTVKWAAILPAGLSLKHRAGCFWLLATAQSTGKNSRARRWMAVAARRLYWSSPSGGCLWKTRVWAGVLRKSTSTATSPEKNNELIWHHSVISPRLRRNCTTASSVRSHRIERTSQGRPRRWALPSIKRPGLLP